MGLTIWLPSDWKRKLGKNNPTTNSFLSFPISHLFQTIAFKKILNLLQICYQYSKYQASRQNVKPNLLRRLLQVQVLFCSRQRPQYTANMPAPYQFRPVESTNNRCSRSFKNQTLHLKNLRFAKTIFLQSPITNLRTVFHKNVIFHDFIISQNIKK